MADYYYRFPAITELTIAQQAALDETRQIALSGGPGTGKSVVSAWRHISNHQQGRKSLLLTYTHSLRRYLASCCKSVNATDARNNIRTSYLGKPSDEPFYEIIVDEGQDLEPDYYESLKALGYLISYGADDSQILYKDHCSHAAELRAIFPDNRQCMLDRNFRSTQNIMLFAREAFQTMFVPQEIIDGLASNPGPKPAVVAGNIFANTLQLIQQLSNDTSNIGILTPWQKDVTEMYNFLCKYGIDCSFYINEDDGSTCPPLKNIHVTTYRSAKGLEFDTVILPEFSFFYFLEKPHPYYTLTEEDMYVAVTRARSNLYLLNKSDNHEFNNRFSGFIE